MGGNSPADLLSDEEDDQAATHHHHHHHQVITQDDSQTSPHSDQTINRSHSLSPSQTNMTNGIDDGLITTTLHTNKSERENNYRCSSPLSPPSHATQPIMPNKMTLINNLPVSSSSNSAKRLTGTLNRLLSSMANRSNGHHYHHQNGLPSSSPSASSSTMTTTNLVDSTAKEPKTTLELSTQSIESE